MYLRIFRVLSKITAIKGENMKKIISTKKAAPGGFSKGVETPLSQATVFKDILFMSGQGPLDAETYEIPEGINEQTHAVMENVIKVLEAADCSLNNVLKMNCYLRNITDFSEFNKVYDSYFSKEKPARTTIEAAPPRKGVNVEIEAIAFLF